ncbi:hypothetical protein [Kitasatospora sp. NPDC058046]|uniref:hypothetical protein n=1 Tax=Kitasatospora sp. NPDC058046 TaxID=3346312 RepID=UPI0036DE1953
MTRAAPLRSVAGRSVGGCGRVVIDEEDRPAAESAVWVAWAATLPAEGPTGGVFYDGERLA